MNDRQWFENMADVADTCDHGEECENCRHVLELAKIVHEYLQREDTGEGSMLRCLKEWGRRTRSLPNLN